MGVAIREVEHVVKESMQVLQCDVCAVEGGTFSRDTYVESPVGWVLLQQKRQDGDDYVERDDDHVLRFCSWRCVAAAAADAMTQRGAA